MKRQNVIGIQTCVTSECGRFAVHLMYVPVHFGSVKKKKEEGEKKKKNSLAHQTILECAWLLRRMENDKLLMSGR
jgi:hypothetical protein